jgi:predicted RNA-binding protein with PUA-like domain
VKPGYPDPFAFKKGHQYYDEASTRDKPTWYTVDIGFVEQFPAIVPLETLKRTKGLEQMVVVQKGSRLSIQPVTKAEFEIVCRLGRRS